MATFPRLEYYPGKQMRWDETIKPPLTDEEVALLYSRPGPISDVGFDFAYDPHYMPMYDPVAYSEALKAVGFGRERHLHDIDPPRCRDSASNRPPALDVPRVLVNP
jgi:hypothetical protein